MFAHVRFTARLLARFLTRTDCTRTRRANSRTRARADYPHSRTGCMHTRDANSRARARADYLTPAPTARARGERTVAPAPVQGPLSHAQTTRARGKRAVAPAPVQAIPLTHRLHAATSCRLLTALEPPVPETAGLVQIQIGIDPTRCLPEGDIARG